MSYTVDAAAGTVLGPRGNPIGSVGANGYVKFTVYGGQKRTVQAHRAIWEAVHGPIPDGLQVNHKNGVKHDNRIENLELVTSSDNHLHAYREGIRGPARGNCKLTVEQVAEIRRDYKPRRVSFARLGRRFGVSEATVRAAYHGRSWKEAA